MFFEEKELKEKLDRDFCLLKMKLTNEEAKKFVDGKLNVICFYEVFNWVDSHEISGGVFMYKDNKPFKCCGAFFKLGTTLDRDYFAKNYENKPIWLGYEFDREAEVFSKDEDVAYLNFTVDRIYNSFEWQNFQTLLKMEDDWLQPDDFLEDE